MREILDWRAVADAARDLGCEEWADALGEVDGAELDRAFDEGAGSVSGKTIQSFEQTSNRRRERLVRSAVAEWEREPGRLLQTAIAVRLILGSRPDDEGKSWQRPAFERANTLVVSHGARSEQVIARELPEEARAIRDLILQDAPADLPRASEVLIEEFARLRVQTRRLSEHLDRVGPIDARGQPRRVLREWRGMISKEIDLAHALGMTPRSQAAIIADRAAGARDAVAARRHALEAEDDLRRRYVEGGR